MADDADSATNCPVCSEDYSETGDKVPKLLCCGHTLCEKCAALKLLNHSQGRIQTVQEGAPTPSRGRLPNVLIKFTGKPYEIKEILVRRGGRAPGASPLRSATEISDCKLECPLCGESHVITGGVGSIPENSRILDRIRRKRLVQESSVVRLCEKHGREISLYCYSCNECLCVLCLLSESDHLKCKPNMYSVQEDKLIASRWKETLEIEKEKLIHARKENEAKSKSCTEKITLQKEQMLLEMTKVFDDLLKKVSNAKKENEIELKDLLEETKADIAEIDDVVKETDSSLSAVLNRIETITKARSKERTTMISSMHYEYTKSMATIQKFCGLVKEGEFYIKHLGDEPQSELISASEDMEDSIAFHTDVASQTNTVRSSNAHYGRDTDEPKDYSNTVRSSNAHYGRDTDEPKDYSNTVRSSNAHYGKDTDEPKNYSNTLLSSNSHYGRDTDEPIDYSSTVLRSNAHYGRDTDEPKDYSNTVLSSSAHYGRDTDKPKDYSNTVLSSNAYYGRDTDEPKDYSNTVLRSNAHYDDASETDSYEEKNSVRDGNDPVIPHGNSGDSCEEEEDSVSDGNSPVTQHGNAGEEVESSVSDGNDPVTPNGNAGDLYEEEDSVSDGSGPGTSEAQSPTKRKRSLQTTSKQTAKRHTRLRAAHPFGTLQKGNSYQSNFRGHLSECMFCTFLKRNFAT